MPKILILTSEFPPQPGGIGVHAHQLAKGLQANGFQVTVVCDRRSRDGEEEMAFDAQQTFEIVRIPRYKLIFWSYFKRILTSLKWSKNTDIVLASGKFSLWQTAFLSRFRKTKYVAVLHGSEIQLPNPLLRKLTESSLKRFHSIIAVSHYTQSLVEHLNLKDIQVIPNGFEMAPSDVKETQNTHAPRLITVGNVTQRKGQHNVICALPSLIKKYPGLQYHIVGIPTEKAKLKKLASDLGVTASVFFHGRVDEHAKRKLLLEADVFVMLSEATKTGDVEGFGIAILEANALGLPAIGALDCGIEDAIKDGVSGRLIDNKDTDQLEKALTDILEHYTVYSQQAKDWSTNFTWNKVIESYLEVMNSLA